MIHDFSRQNINNIFVLFSLTIFLCSIFICADNQEIEFIPMNSEEHQQFIEFCKHDYLNQLHSAGMVWLTMKDVDKELNNDLTLKFGDANNFFYKIVSKNNKELIGKIWWTLDNESIKQILPDNKIPSAFLELLWVEPTFRSKGYGKKILLEFEKYCAKYVKQIALHVFRNNKIAISLYKKNGYCEYRETPFSYYLKKQL